MSHWEMVITKYDGKIFLTVRGLESKATPLHLSSMGAEWFGIRFKLGTVMPHLPASGLVGDFSLPTGRIATVTVPTLVIDGGEASWLSHAAQAVADVLPNAQRHTLKGQPHNVAPEAIAPVLIEFFNQ